MPIYRCKICNYLYIDEQREVPFEKLNENFKCPKCHASKPFFIKKEI